LKTISFKNTKSASTSHT